MGTKEDSATRERKALRYSLVVATALAVLAAFWGWISQSQVILLDGVYALIGMVLTALSLRVSRIADSGPTARFPFGKEALIPVVIAVQGMALLATLAYAAVEAVRVILAGGADVTAGSLVAYGAVSAVVSIIIWRYVRQVDRTSDLLVAEARQWGASAAFSALVAVGAVVAMILGRTDFSDADRYVDSRLGPPRLCDAGPATVRTSANRTDRTPRRCSRRKRSGPRARSHRRHPRRIRFGRTDSHHEQGGSQAVCRSDVHGRATTAGTSTVKTQYDARSPPASPISPTNRG